MMAENQQSDIHEAHKRQRYLHKFDPRIEKAYDIFLTSFIHLVYLTESILLIYYLVTTTLIYTWLILIICLLIIVADALFVTIRRKGKEYLWFSPGTFAFTIVSLTPIWQVVFLRIETEDSFCDKNITEAYPNSDSIFGSYKLCEFLEVTVTVFVLTCILTKWLFPTHAKFTREHLVALLTSYIVNGTDIVEFFSYVDEEEVFENKSLVYAILIFFSLSSIQFSFVLSSTLERKKGFLGVFFGTSIWTIFFSILLQDLPLCILRTIILAGYRSEKKYLLYFFTIKNYIVIIFSIYMIINILLDKRHINKIQEKFELNTKM